MAVFVADKSPESFFAGVKKEETYLVVVDREKKVYKNGRNLC